MIKIVIVLLITIGILAGCTSSNEETTQQKPVNNVQAASIKQSNKYANNPQAPATDSLKEIGQTFSDEDGEVSLEAISEHQSTNQIGPIKLSIKDVKLMNYTPALHLIDYFHSYTHKESNFNYIKLQVTIKNTSSETIDFAPVSILETDQGEQKDFSDDFYLQNLSGELHPNELKSGELAFILEHTKIDMLESVSILTSDVFNEDKISIASGKDITIHFE